MKSSILILSRHRNTLQLMFNRNEFNLSRKGIDITTQLIADKESASSNAKKNEDLSKIT